MGWAVPGKRRLDKGRASLRVEESVRSSRLSKKFGFLISLFITGRPARAAADPDQSPHPVKRRPHRRLEPVVIHAVRAPGHPPRHPRQSTGYESFRRKISARIRRPGPESRLFHRTAGAVVSALMLLVRRVVTRVGLIPA